MVGSVLYPLNRLKSVSGELYQQLAERYSNRRDLMEQRIPKLNCYWNDVIHCIPIHPHLLYEAMIHAGMRPQEREYLQIDVSLLVNVECAVFAFNTSPPIPVPDHEVALVEPDSFEELTDIPVETKEWYKYLAVHSGRLHLTYRYVPHFFVKGTIDLSNAGVVNWKDPP